MSDESTSMENPKTRLAAFRDRAPLPPHTPETNAALKIWFEHFRFAVA
jgi:hypothetical protein